MSAAADILLADYTAMTRDPVISEEFIFDPDGAAFPLNGICRDKLEEIELEALKVRQVVCSLEIVPESGMPALESNLRLLRVRTGDTYKVGDFRPAREANIGRILYLQKLNPKKVIGGD